MVLVHQSVSLTWWGLQALGVWRCLVDIGGLLHVPLSFGVTNYARIQTDSIIISANYTHFLLFWSVCSALFLSFFGFCLCLSSLELFHLSSLSLKKSCPWPLCAVVKHFLSSLCRLLHCVLSSILGPWGSVGMMRHGQLWWNCTPVGMSVWGLWGLEVMHVQQGWTFLSQTHECHCVFTSLSSQATAPIARDDLSWNFVEADQLAIGSHTKL